MNTRIAFTLGSADFSRRVLLATTVLLCARFLLPETFDERSVSRCPSGKCSNMPHW
jgi:hypothetical protein